MNGILVTLVDEAPTLPTMVIDIIMAQFLRAASLGGRKTKANGDVLADGKQSTLLVKELPAAYKMAEFICNTCTEKMARYISQYFNDVIMEVSEMTGKDSKLNDRRRSDANVDDDDERGTTEADLKELTKAHRLLRELWRASPAVLQNVIPQLEAELSAENIDLRLLATETLGDIISGVGAAGPPSPPMMDPTAYPPMKLAETLESPVSNSVLTTPMSPQSFAQTHPSVYHSFIGRKNDRSALIRSAWTTAIGRILTTSAGGIGISREDEITLVNGLAEKLNDADERVRIAAIRAVGSFSFRDVMTKLGISGDVGKSGSVLCSLADRARDKRHPVRVEGMTLISKLWGVAAGEILAGNEAVISMLGAIPSKVLETFYANAPDVNILLDHVMFEQLIPLSYPPTRSKGSKHANGESQATQANGDEPFDADKVRTERILVMIRSLDPKSKKAFFAIQSRQKSYRDVLTAFLKQCEEYNGGTIEGDEKKAKDQLTRIIAWFSNFFHDKPRASQDLWKYAKIHDRRSYQLIRFAIALESDFKTVFKAIKEFSKRMESASGSPTYILETLIPLIYRGGSLVYNRSHLPAILEFSRNDAHGLGATAHEVLNEISKSNPHIFKAQVKELCKLLQEQAPTLTKANDFGSVETLKACAAYARRYPEEIARDRKFTQALVSFAQYGEPPKAAKYAVTILMAATERKEMHARDLLQKSTKDWTYGSDHFLTKLAAVSQLMLLEPNAVDDATNDAIIDITTQHIMLQVRTPAHKDDRNWQDESELDEELQAKCWALKVLVNQLRSIEDPERIRASASPVLKLLNALVHKEGDISKTQSTPIHHKSRLRLVAAKLLLKLCTNKMFEGLLSPIAFNHLALVAQDSIFQVRRGFVEKVQKYLVQDKLTNRFYAILFLVAFEPDMQFRQVTVTWIRSRVKIFHEKKEHTMEAIVPRLLSLLAHHPDYSSDAGDLVDTARYILFYVSSVGNEDNLGLIFKYAERVKQVGDAIKPTESQNLYVLSDLAQAVIRKWQEKKGWTMQSYPGKIGLSKDLFTPMQSHAAAQEVAEKQYLPEEMDDMLSALIRANDKKVSHACLMYEASALTNRLAKA
jgi:sister chromatid cohesion protein PDS5